MSGVAIDAAGKSAELSAKWTQDTLAKVEAMSKAKAEPADYAKAMTDFASAQAETAAEHMSAFAEIAKPPLEVRYFKVVCVAGHLFLSLGSGL